MLSVTTATLIDGALYGCRSGNIRRMPDRGREGEGEVREDLSRAHVHDPYRHGVRDVEGLLVDVDEVPEAQCRHARIRGNRYVLGQDVGSGFVAAHPCIGIAGMGDVRIRGDDGVSART